MQYRQIKILISFISRADRTPEPAASVRARNGWVSGDGQTEEGPLAKIARKVVPHYILVLYTPDFEKNVGPNSDYIRQHPEIFGKECRIIPIPLADGFPGFNAINFYHLRQTIPSKVNDVLAQIRKEHGDANYQISINASSGTPQMAAVLYSSVNFDKIPASSLNLFPEDARREHIKFYNAILWEYTGLPNGGVAADEFHDKETQDFTLDFLNEDSVFERMRDAAAKFDFHLMEIECRELKRNRPEGIGKALAHALEQVCIAAQLADQMNFGENKNDGMSGDADDTWRQSAVSVLNRLHVWLREKGEILKSSADPDVMALCEWIADYREVIRKLAANSKPDKGIIIENEWNLVELFRNVHRAYARGAFTDVLSRYYRLGEGIVYYVLNNKYHENARVTGNICKNVRPDLPTSFLTIYKRVFPNDVNQHYTKKGKTFDWDGVMTSRTNSEFRRGSDGLGFHRAYKLLSFFCIDETERTGVKAFLEEKEVYDGGSGGEAGELGMKIRAIREIRNATIVAHSMGPVTEENAKTAIEVLDTLMERAHLIKDENGNPLLPEIPADDPIMSAAKLAELIRTLEKYPGNSPLQQ